MSLSFITRNVKIYFYLWASALFNTKSFTHWPTLRSDPFVFRYIDTLYWQGKWSDWSTLRDIKLNVHLKQKNVTVTNKLAYTTKSEVQIQNLHTYVIMYEYMKYLHKHSYVQTRTCAYVRQPYTDAHTPTSTPKYMRSSPYNRTHTHACEHKKKMYCL